jgi:hypothetical protein
MTQHKEDKIFNNRYNTGDIEYEVFKKIQVHDKFAPRDTLEEYAEQQMQEDLYVIFQNSTYFTEYSTNKKFSRSEVAIIYYYFDERLPNTKDVPAVEKFIAIAEFMGVPYEALYEELGPVYKEAIIKELDNKYKIFKRRNIKRLF